jgi:hypothetical protein
MGSPMSRRSVPVLVLAPLLVVALVISSSACGTIANFGGGALPLSRQPQDPPPPVAYGGVQWDIERGIKGEATVGEKVLWFPLWLLDLGLSTTFDTATLPIVFWINARRAWDRATGDHDPAANRPKKGTSPSWGLFPDPYRPTPAEQVLNPPPDGDDEE